MDTLADWLIDFVSSSNDPVGLLVLAASAMIEYVFPPFPGDTITLFGAVLITAYEWSFTAVFSAVLAGSVAGAMLAFYGGRYLARRGRPRPDSKRGKAIARLVAKFHRRGPAYLVLNRFLPGLRALFFVAAGMAQMRALSVAVYAAISAALWNLGLIGIGALLGANLETLKRWVARYTMVVWIALGAAAIIYLGVGVGRRWRARRAAKHR